MTGPGSPTHSPKAILHQLDLFATIPSENKRKNRDHANTIATWDIAPLWFSRQPDKNTPKVERRFTLPVSKQELLIDIRPAHLVSENKKTGEMVTEMVYPGEREQIIEETLRKLAANGRGGISNDHEYVTCSFTLKELRKELTDAGHDLSRGRIVRSLEILRKSSVMMTSGDGNGFWVETNYLPTIAGTNNADWREAATTTTLTVFFHPMISYAIRRNLYRTYDFKTAMSLSTVAARYLFKRIVHYIKGADTLNKMVFNIPNLGRNSGFYDYAQAKETNRRWREVMEELERHGLIMSTKYKKAEGTRPAQLTFYATPHLRDHVLIANQHYEQITGTQKLLPGIRHRVRP